MSSLCLMLIKSSWLNSGSELAFLTLELIFINTMQPCIQLTLLFTHYLSQQKEASWIVDPNCKGVLPVGRHWRRMHCY